MVGPTDETHSENRTEVALFQPERVEFRLFYLDSDKNLTLRKPKNQNRFFGISVKPGLT
jgi:hypothetical protein